MSLNTAIRGLQIRDAFFGDGLKRNGSDGDIAELDLKSSGGLKIDTAQLAVEPADFAGKGVADDGADKLRLDINGLDAVAVDASADSIAILDADDNLSYKESIADLITAIAGDGLGASAGVLALDLNELTGAVVDVTADSIAIIDATDDSTKKESIADLATAMAGSGITATNGVLSVDAITDNIVEGDIAVEDESANCNEVTTDFTLDNTPIANSVQVFLNGLLQQEGSGKDYTLSGTTVSFATAPETNDILIIHYIINN
ncbi:MAG: hypothetical protein JW924_03420 [Fusobacteriaceae bacterium]|nr:hypothetical protein [Fusobacteriaceae bacterium]